MSKRDAAGVPRVSLARLKFRHSAAVARERRTSELKRLDEAFPPGMRSETGDWEDFDRGWEDACYAYEEAIWTAFEEYMRSIGHGAAARDLRSFLR